MLPLLSLHAIAAQRGDGLRPELLAAFRRSATADRAVVDSAMDRENFEATPPGDTARDVPLNEKTRR